MYHTTSNQPIIIDFDEIPKGGELKLIAGIYSSRGYFSMASGRANGYQRSPAQKIS
jgi:hypothetical protein